MQRDIIWYLDTAKARQGFKSDRQLSSALGYSSAVAHQLRSRFTPPSDETMVKLATMAGVPASEALMDLNIWRSKSTEVRSAYEKIAAQLKGAAIIAALALPLFGSQVVEAEQSVDRPPSGLTNVYIMRFIRWLSRRIPRGICRRQALVNRA